MELQERDHQDANARYRVSYGQYFHQVGEQEDRT
jgi:hypothetical protein